MVRARTVGGMRRWWLLAILTILLAAAPRAALACSCAGVSKPQAAQNASVVFSGRVTSVTRPFAIGISCTSSSEDPVVAVFEVETVYKSELPATTTVRTVVGGASCGYDFVAERRYTVFATVGANGLETNLCRGNVEGAITPSEYGLPAGHPPARSL